MKINRLELIARVRSRVGQLEQQAEGRHRQAVDKAEADLNEYLSRTRQAWADLATMIRVRLRQDRPIVISDVPDAIRGSWGVAVFKPTRVDPVETARTEGLRTLLALLESSPDEMVSTTALDRMGAPLRSLLRS